MIPVLGVPYINRPDLLTRMFESIDHPVDRLVIVDNSPDGSAPAPEGSIHIASHHNLGVAASWNLIIRSNPLAPWWLIVNSDIAFGPGNLATLEGMVGEEPAIYEMFGCAAFAINREAVIELGSLDENFHPAYLEDDDLRYRTNLLGIPRIEVPANINHYGSAVISSDNHYRVENDRTFVLNRSYYVAKWGGLPNEERFSTPFDQGGSTAHWDFDFRRLRQLTWRER